MKLMDPRSLRFIAAAIVVLNGFFPALWILLTSLKTEAELVAKPITYWPHNPTLQNYVQAFTDQPLLRYLGNSAMVAVGSTVLSLFVAALAAYAIARLNLKRRQLILTCIVASSMFPLVTLLVPIFETMRTLGLLNSYTALVLPYIVLNLPVCTLVLVSFFQSIPKDLYEAAEVDGASKLRQHFYITIPMLSNVTFFNLVIGIIGALQVFAEPFVLTNGTGSPNNATLLLPLYLYRVAFTYLEMGYASAIAWVVFAITLVLTVLVFRSLPMWVHTEAGED